MGSSQADTPSRLEGAEYEIEKQYGVDHQLASIVLFLESLRGGSNPPPTANAPMLKLVDRLDLGSSAARHVGSSPTWGTNFTLLNL